MGTSLLIKIPEDAKFREHLYVFDFDDEGYPYSSDPEYANDGQALLKRLQCDIYVSFDGREFDTYDKIWAHIGIGYSDHAQRKKEKLIGFAIARGLEYRDEL